MSPSKQHFQKLFDYTVWANRRAFESAERSTIIPTLAPILGHILGAEIIWYERVTGEAQEIAERVWTSTELAWLKDLIEFSHGLWTELLSTRFEATAESIISYRNLSGEPLQLPLTDILVHVNNHGSYHRGQIAMKLRESGNEPIESDYSLFCRELKNV